MSGSIRQRLDVELYKKAEERAEAARLAPMIATNTQSLKAAETGTKTFWSRELAEVHQSLNRQKPTSTSWVAAIAPPTDSNESPMLAGIDFGVSLPTIAQPATEAEARARGAAEKNAFQEFADTLSTRGWTLNESGLARLVLFSMSNARGRQADLTLVESWFACFDRLLQLGAFSEDEVGFDESLIAAVAPIPEKPYDLETSDTTTREGSKRARAVIEAEYYGVEVAQLWQAWKKSLNDNFDYRPSEAVERQVCDYFVKNNLNFLDRRSYDRARKAFTLAQIFPPACMLPEEILAERIERSDLSDREVLREIRQETRKLRR